jgi:hypothetical protein
MEGRRGGRCAGTEEETVEELGRLEQADEGTWKSQGDVECEKAKQNDIDMKYKDEVIDWRRDGHCRRMGVELLSLTETRRGGLKKVLVSHDGTMRLPRGDMAVKRESPRAKLKVKLTEVMKEWDDTTYHPFFSEVLWLGSWVVIALA